MAARQFQSWGGHYVNKSATGREFQGWDGHYRIFKAAVVTDAPEEDASIFVAGQQQPVIEVVEVVGY